MSVRSLLKVFISIMKDVIYRIRASGKIFLLLKYKSLIVTRASFPCCCCSFSCSCCCSCCRSCCCSCCCSCCSCCSLSIFTVHFSLAVGAADEACGWHEGKCSVRSAGVPPELLKEALEDRIARSKACQVDLNKSFGCALSTPPQHLLKLMYP